MLTRRTYRACLSAILLTFGVIFYLLLITNICHAIHDGSLVDFDFPSEINLIPGASLEADLIVTVKNTGDQIWTACEVIDWPISRYYPSYRIKVTDQSWNPNAVNVFSKMYHLDPNETDTSTNTLLSLPDDIGEYSFTLECEYHDTECTDSYQLMKNTPVIIRFNVVSIGAISGRITDSKGDPISSLEVVAYDSAVGTEILGSSTTDANGDYTIDRVRAGIAYVSIELGEVIIWYDGKEGIDNPTSAKEVYVTAGQTTNKINIGVTKKTMPWIPLLLDD
ncbi:MAG: carboxypeptidase-like regulatory domain-containing protein [Desulfobacterales bacterium]|jgi:hypothetical protein